MNNIVKKSTNLIKAKFITYTNQPITRMKSFKELNVYQDSITFVTKIYGLTSQFPKSELFGITNQISRSAVSIPSNIAEGSARNHPKEHIQFLYIALGSATELDAQLEISFRLKFITSEEYQTTSTSIESICRMLQGMIKFQKSKLIAKTPRPLTSNSNLQL